MASTSPSASVRVARSPGRHVDAVDQHQVHQLHRQREGLDDAAMVASAGTSSGIWLPRRRVGGQVVGQAGVELEGDEHRRTARISPARAHARGLACARGQVGLHQQRGVGQQLVLPFAQPDLAFDQAAHHAHVLGPADGVAAHQAVAVELQAQVRPAAGRSVPHARRRARRPTCRSWRDQAQRVEHVDLRDAASARRACPPCSAPPRAPARRRWAGWR
jgi:hypothetical protein